MTSLFHLVADARGRYLFRGLADGLLVGPYLEKDRLEMDLRAAEQVAEKVLLVAWHGDSLLARRLARVFADNADLANEPPDDEPLDYADYPEILTSHLETLVPRDLYDLAYSPQWSAFVWVCELADRIPGFLASLERGGPGGALARGCREDLDGLAVLSGWCEENGLPRAAAEARHLHGLVRRETW